MELPHGDTPISALRADDDILAHAYDPAYARAYYLRTRKLKGRKAGSAPKQTASQKKSSEQYSKNLKSFLSGLPMAKAGKDIKEVEKFVDSMRGKKDADLKKAAAAAKDPSEKATIEALLAKRDRIRKAKASGGTKKKADKPTSGPPKPGTPVARA